MDTLARLEQVIAERRSASPDSSYVAKLNAKGIEAVAQKVGEEAVETIIAALSESREEVIGESADLIFHLLVLLQSRRIKLSEVMEELDRREGTSGLEEKASRKDN
ncbi:phosphoribosyl-ATP pyrophosphatase [Altererythrobacter xiamenensis]|uniref:Phosphoribosyl-ATP pyrophosphatase n=1 Tax=Altererythrobacter xiamenensis TaxID=1316679 RepID=A0A1Y6F8V2_9SPHN|nr:phosphoribosyl-ATP diphosphatase [Altererythrobacter xiamenensis]SMQ69790.1 phosphoribosyl-ATP pyrophosphatase [Altererythrobacter xiamenensis]